MLKQLKQKTRNLALPGKNVGKKERVSKKIKDVLAGREVALEPASKVTDAFDAKRYKLKVKLNM